MTPRARVQLYSLVLALLSPRVVAQANCGYASASLVSDIVQGAPYTISCTTTLSSNSATVTWSVEGTFIQSGYSSQVYWGPSLNAVTGHGTCQVVGNPAYQLNCSPQMTTDLVQTNDPSAVSQFDNIAQDEINNGTGCLLGAVRVTTSLVPGDACKDGGGGGGCDDTDGASSPNCIIECCCDPDGEGCTPIIVDTTGEGFHLTSGDNGVMFDFLGNGHPFKLSWTAANSGNAFLACLDCWKDLPNTGKIDSGKKLFGNLTEQPPSPHPNGYLALAEFDKPENGGNGDGIIDSRDAVYSKLLLWIDENHDGISQPDELHSLPELGVFSISLKYKVEPFVDQYGNRFRYRGVLNPDPLDGKSKDGRYTYDVLFVSGRAAEGSALHSATPPRFAWDRLLDPSALELTPYSSVLKPAEDRQAPQNNQ
jgi:hypothetical protein